ncbi:MAG: ATP-binding protein [Pseudomonadota bacterium]
MLLKKYLPKSLFWRTVLIVVLPMVILQAVVTYLFVERHFDGVTRQMTAGVASELRYMVESVEGAETAAEAKSQVARAARTLGFDIELEEGATVQANPEPIFYDVILRAITEEVRERIFQKLAIEYEREEKRVLVWVETRHGVVGANIPRNRIVASNPHLLLVWMAVTAVALIGVALVYLRNQVRPIQALAKAADAFGKGRTLALSPSGAQEVRMAAGAFLDMRERIDRHINQRTAMLSGVSHDMRTPLTRMKLALEMMDDSAEIAELRHDVKDLEHILEEFLDYARGEHGESYETVDVLDLAREVVGEARRKGAEISLYERIEMPGETRMSLRPRSIKRCLHNLVDNALSYGERVMLRLTVNRAFIEVAVEDDGPGIPAEQREAAFRPFNRLDEARNRNRAGGVGLGLALALDTARSHGGELILDDGHTLGGLLARLRLPR